MENQAVTAAVQTHPFEFRGNAREYFGIWIVNLLLSILTLGIYTAWAKVRRLRYFYGNTFLDGHNFEYHAKPIQILIGRIIVIGFLALVNVLVNFVHPAFALLFVPYLMALPWLLNKAVGFNARMTSYRNVRLSFSGTYWAAFGIFVAMPFAVIFTAGILGPLASQLSSNYLGRNLKYGTARFDTNAPLGALYGNWGMTLLLTLLAAAAFGGAGYLIGGVISGFNTLAYTGTDTDISEMLAGATIVSAAVGFYLALILSFLFYAAGVRNIAFGATTLEGGHRFSSTLGRLRFTFIMLTNFIVTILTLSLMRPWAVVRSWRYLADNTGLLAAGPLDGFVDQAMPEGGVAAAEYLDIEGIDFGL